MRTGFLTIIISVTALLSIELTASAQLDTAVTNALGAKLDEYMDILGTEPADVKCGEADFLIGSCSDSLVRQFTAMRLFRHFMESKLMGDESVAIHIFDNWFSDGKVKMPDETDFMSARIFAEFNRQSLIGNKAPELYLEDISGSYVSLFGDGKRNDRPSILFFYDSGCATCKMESIMLRSLLNGTEYPVDALREAILNALIHRDYSIHSEGTPVQIDFFADRLEIHSPGNLYGRMSIEQLGIAKPNLRNPALALMAETLTAAENRYSGIPIMRNAMKEYGLPEPKFENRRNGFSVTFYNTAQVAEEPEKAEPAGDLATFCRVPKTRQEIASYLGVKTVFYAMRHYVQPMIAAGKLAMTMPEKPKSRNQKYYTVGEGPSGDEGVGFADSARIGRSQP